MRSDIDHGESLPVPLPPVQQKYLSLEGYTVSSPGQRPGIADGKERCLEGYMPAKMAAQAATPPLSLHFPFKIGIWERT